MAKIVRYNGGNQSCYDCTKPSQLVVGEKYEVIKSYDRGCQTDYTLKGVDGQFNSAWFDEVFSSVDTITMAIAHCIPTLGKPYKCFKLEFVNGQPTVVDWYTNPVKEIQDMGNNIYQVTTRSDSVYIVQVR